MNFKNTSYFFALVYIVLSLGCSKKATDELASPIVAQNQKSLYVSSGTCYSGGGNTTFTATSSSNIIYTVNLSTGLADTILADYTTATEPVGNSPTSIVDTNTDYFYALIESVATANRKIDKIPKKFGVSKSFYYTNSTDFTTALRSLTYNPADGSLLISKSTAVEKINGTPSRMKIAGTSPWINAPAGNCATSTSIITSVQLLKNEKILYTHAGAGQNRIGLIAKTGYAVAGDCLLTASPIAAPSVSAFPTSSIYINDKNDSTKGFLLVAYAGSTAGPDINSIYTYDVDESAVSIGNTVSTSPTKSYENSAVLYGVSAMAYDSSTDDVYVATANGTSSTIANYNIEKFHFDTTTKLLTRSGSKPFSYGWIGSKCISSMFVGD